MHAHVRHHPLSNSPSTSLPPPHPSSLPDGVTPIFAATLWGYSEVARELLSRGCDPQRRNRNGTDWTALHAAALQEDAKMCHMLLEAGADATVRDRDGRTATDFATVSTAVWPFFAARGCVKTAKRALLEMGIIRRAAADEIVVETRGSSSPTKGELLARGRSAHLYVPEISRPGSAYVRNDRLNAFSSGRASAPASATATAPSFRGSSRGSTAALRGRGFSGPTCDLFADDEDEELFAAGAAERKGRATDAFLGDAMAGLEL